MHEKSLQTLEYTKILAKIAKEAAFSASKDLVMALEPTSDLEEARRRLAYIPANPVLSLVLICC